MIKLRDLSIRNKLFATNFLMIIIPILIVLIITGILMPAWIYFVNGMNPEARLSDSLGFISVYQLQRNVSTLEKYITVQSTVNSIGQSTSSVYKDTTGENTPVFNKDGTNILLTTQALNICKSIDKSGAMLAILVDNKTIYLSKGSSLSDISQIFAEVNQNADIYKDSMINASQTGTVLTDVSKLNTGETLRIIVADPTMTGIVGGSDESPTANLITYGNKLIIILFIIAIIAVLLTNGLIALFLAKSILNPLNKLRNATHEIRDGNLDSEIGYKSNNEIGQVCSDFDEMRLRLKKSVEDRQRYEENRIQMIAGISHDLSTPLTSIKGYTSGLIDGIADTPEKREHYLKIIYNTANDMEKLVDELSLSSKLDLDIIPFYFSKFNISLYFKDCIDELITTLARNKIELIFINNIENEVYITIDSAQFRRAIMNVIENCIKYKTKDSDNCKVKISLDLEENYRNVVITVEDNGIGVPESELEKIFSRFYRSDKARSNSGKGSGLGLAITRQIITRLQGKIDAQISDMGGLSIIIIFPIVESHTAL